MTDVYAKEYALKQARLQRDLNNLDNMLCHKQYLVKNMAASGDNMQDVRDQYEVTETAAMCAS